MEERLRDLAAKQGRDVGVLVEDAVRDYLEAAAITDLGPADAAETQIALISELRDIAEWKGGRE